MAFGVKTNERPGTRAQVRHARFSAYKAREVLDLIMARYAFAAMDLLEDEGDTDAETDEGSAAFIRDAG